MVNKMNLTEKYISEYIKDFEFHFSERITGLT